MNKLSFIIPCYFNEENIPHTKVALLENEKLFESKNIEFEYVFIDDGSKDNTYIELKKFHLENPNKVKVVKLVKNVGSYNALLAGMKYATGNCNIIIAADMQDPVELSFKMYEYWEKGIKLILANRTNRPESFISKSMSRLFHRLLRKFAMKEMPKGGFDFVFFDKIIKEQVLKISEKNSNVLYLMPWLGYDFVNIPYERKERKYGKSKWTISKKIKLFIDSFFSFSYLPIRIISILGIFLSIITFLYSIFIIIFSLFGSIEVKGWPTLLLVMLLIGSFQFFSLGILGEYLWRIFDNQRKRPIYLEDEILDEAKEGK